MNEILGNALPGEEARDFQPTQDNNGFESPAEVIDYRAQSIADLRAACDWLEANPHVPMPYVDVLYAFIYGDDKRTAKEHLAAVARIGGPYEKSNDANFYKLSRSFGSLSVHICANRGDVCERVVTGVHTITKEIPDPNAPKVTVTEEVEIVEWRCPDSLLSEVA